MSSTIAFKLCLANNNTHRFTVSPGTTTFATLDATAQQFYREAAGAPTEFPARLSWEDDDGDAITLASQSDLDECFAFLAKTTSTALKISVLAAPAITSHALPLDTGKGQLLPQHKDHHEEEEDLVSPKLLKKLTEMDSKIGEGFSKCMKEVEELTAKGAFDEKEYQRQLQVLVDAEIPIYPFIRLALAKRLVFIQETSGGDSSAAGFWARKGFEWGSSFSPRIEKKLDDLLPRTKQQVLTFRDKQLPCGWIVVGYLEMQNRLLAENAARGRDQDRVAVVSRQLAQLAHLKNIPEPALIHMLQEHNEETAKQHANHGSCCHHHHHHSQKHAEEESRSWFSGWF